MSGFSVQVLPFGFDSFAHPGGGFFGEGERQDLFWLDSLVYQVEDFFSYNSRFAGTGAGGDELGASAGYGAGRS